MAGIEAAEAGMDVDVSEEAVPLYEDLFATLPTQAKVIKKKTLTITPFTSIDSTGPIQFQIVVGANEQILPSGIRIESGIDIRGMRTKTKLKGWDLAEPTATAKSLIEENVLVPVDGMGHALFSDITVFINDTKIDGGDGMYAYKGAMHNKLFTTIDQKKGTNELKGLDWHEQKPFEDIFSTPTEYCDAVAAKKEGEKAMMNVIESKNKNEQVFGRRYCEIQNNPLIHYSDEIYSEIFQQPKPLPPKTKLTIFLTRNRPEFCLLNNCTTPKNINCFIHFEYCRLKVPVLVLEEGVAQEMLYDAHRKKQPFRYPVRQVAIQGVPKNSGMLDLSIDNILTGTVTPRRIFVCFVKSEALSGSYKLDPFNFDFFKIAEVTCRLGGQLSALPALECPSQNDYVTAVTTLLTTLGGLGSGADEIGITRKNFKNRNAFFAFDMTGMSGVEFADCFTREEESPVGLFIRMDGGGSAYNLTVLIYKEYDSEIEIDATGKVKPLPNA